VITENTGMGSIQPALLLAACLLINPSMAAEPDGESERALESVLVIGERSALPVANLAGSLDVMSRSEIDYEHVDDTMELFTKIPGVYLSRFNQGIINTDLSVRGFAGDGSTPHATLLIDGIPSNLNSGYGEMDQVFPLGIESIHVFKGTSDPRYGLFNLAGNYNLVTRSDANVAEAEVTAGSYAAREAQGYVGLTQGGLRHSYFLGYRDAEGYRDHTDLEKFSASGRWFYDFSARTSLGFIARASGYEGDAPGYLARDVARSRPRSSAAFADQDGGKKRVQHYSAHLDTGWGPHVDLSVKAYRQHFERERWVRFSAAGAVQNRFDDQWHSGALARLAWRLSEQWRLEWGANGERQNNLEQRFGTIGQSRQRDRANLLRDWRYTFDTHGSYLQVEQEPSPMLRWNAAVRADRIDGDFEQFNAAGVRTARRIYDFGTIVQPKLNVFLMPTAQVTLFANYGRSFQHPFGGDAFTTGSTHARDVSINDGWEGGVKWSPIGTVELRASYWRQDAKDEFVVVDGTPRSVGKTERKGVDFAGNWRPWPQLYVWGNYATIDTTIVTPASSQAALVGNELRSIPDYTASFGAAYEIGTAWTARVHIDSQGDYFVNEANLGGKYGGYTLANVGLEYAARWGSIGAQVNNLLDRFHEYVFDFSADGTDTVHSPADGINGSVTVRLRF
jgi:iron complex outermembrane receptor protein